MDPGAAPLRGLSGMTQRFRAKTRTLKTECSQDQGFGPDVAGGAETAGAVAVSAGVAGVVQSGGLALQSTTMVGAAEGPELPADGRIMLWPLSICFGSVVVGPSPVFDCGAAAGGDCGGVGVACASAPVAASDNAMAAREARNGFRVAARLGIV